jgi:hypothetical protein
VRFRNEKQQAHHLIVKGKQPTRKQKGNKTKMKLRSLLTIAGIAVIAAAASAQQGPVAGRSFSYTSSMAADGDYSASGTTALSVDTKVTVNPYLYITGNLGANWIVNGWGSGQDTQVNVIKFFHNETLTLVCSNFDNPAKTSGTKTGAQAVSLSGQFALLNDKTGASLYDSGMLPIGQLNSLFTAAGPNFGTKDSGGVLRLQLGRQISIDPTVGPGTYENVGTITVVRN